ncbi:helitron_like_N domain-containing protein [Trichonephila inaurata madagascariensis]|uniref:Helitron_like_N domain-containing protein n=1 Tax=Trichonephila inaurata madagascariensis TaxID=2747483 RepID=A0A8X7CNL1_9ARAC|nr:helitron_like_N domain-containing protein [Trichonephila inaurata madagascariensis]
MARTHQKLSFLQIYFMGNDHIDKNISCGIYSGIKPELKSQLQNSLHEHNKHIIDFKAAINSVPKDQKEFKVVINDKRKPFVENKGRFNAPQKWPLSSLDKSLKNEISFSVVETVPNETHRTCDALLYPLRLFRGEDGYQINIPKRH